MYFQKGITSPCITPRRQVSPSIQPCVEYPSISAYPALVSAMGSSVPGRCPVNWDDSHATRAPMAFQTRYSLLEAERDIEGIKKMKVKQIIVTNPYKQLFFLCMTFLLSLKTDICSRFSFRDRAYTTQSDSEPIQIFYCNGGKHQFSETGYSDLFGKHGKFQKYEQTAETTQ